jgi:hypothetical protein
MEVTMTNKQVLEKAIQKAIDGGFTENDMGQDIKTVQDVYYYFDDDHGDLSVNDLIWRHDFAKALWGTEPRYVQYSVSTGKIEASTVATYEWQYHLQNMVISEDPIEYLGQNI